MARTQRKDHQRSSLFDAYASVVDAKRAQGADSELSSDVIDIRQEFARREKLRNDDTEQDIALRRTTLGTLLLFLAIETFLVFLFTFFQAIRWPFGFRLNEWSFRILVGGTIAQVATMVIIAVKYLFPEHKRKG